MELRAFFVNAHATVVGRRLLPKLGHFAALRDENVFDVTIGARPLAGFGTAQKKRLALDMLSLGEQTNVFFNRTSASDESNEDNLLLPSDKHDLGLLYTVSDPYEMQDEKGTQKRILVTFVPPFGIHYTHSVNGNRLILKAKPESLQLTSRALTNIGLIIRRETAEDRAKKPILPAYTNNIVEDSHVHDTGRWKAMEAAHAKLRLLAEIVIELPAAVAPSQTINVYKRMDNASVAFGNSNDTGQPRWTLLELTVYDKNDVDDRVGVLL